MHKYTLYDAQYLSDYGVEPLFVGANAARMGLSLDQLLGFYLPSYRYDEEFFRSIVFGFKNSDLGDYKSEDVFDHNAPFVMENIIANDSVEDILFDQISSETADIAVGVRTKTMMTARHKKYKIDFTIELYDDAYCDGRLSKYWHLESRVITSAFDEINLRYSRDNTRFKVGSVVWIENQFGVSKGVEILFWYQHVLNTTNLPHSSCVANLIKKLVINYENNYQLAKR